VCGSVLMCVGVFVGVCGCLFGCVYLCRCVWLCADEFK
jgi:hypothetical protein